VTTIGLIGSGNIGQAIAALAIAHGHEVVLSNSRGPESLADLAAELGPLARAATPAQASANGDVVVVTVPFKNYERVPAAPLAGKIVIDTNNYYWERDGRRPGIEDGTQSVSGLLAKHLVGALVVKAFNNIQAAQIVSDATPAGTAGRRALPIAGDDPAAKTVVATLIDEFGFDVVDAGPLAEGVRFDRDTAAYGHRFDAGQLRVALGLS
jgi:predicted dinucleotide-binding enzyme